MHSLTEIIPGFKLNCIYKYVHVTIRISYIYVYRKLTQSSLIPIATYETAIILNDHMHSVEFNMYTYV